MNPFTTNLDPLTILIIIALSIWQFGIKGIALWRASQLKQRNWFIFLFVIIPFNDFAVVEIIYLFWFAKKRLTFKEVKSWIKRS
jgi:hypothetical protein